MRTLSALILVTLLPACGLTERCSTQESKSYPAPGREDVPAIAPTTLQATLPKLDGWGPPSSKAETKKLGSQDVSSVSVVYQRKGTIDVAAAAAPDAASSAVAASSAAPVSSAVPASSAAAASSTAAVDGAPGAADASLQKVTITILDGRYLAEAYAPFAVLMHYRGELAEPHKRSIQLAGHPGIEQWDPTTGTVNALLLVGQRFVVTLEGQNLTPPEVKAWLNAIDLGQLGSWGKPTTPAPTP